MAATSFMPVRRTLSTKQWEKNYRVSDAQNEPNAIATRPSTTATTPAVVSTNRALLASLERTAASSLSPAPSLDPSGLGLASVGPTAHVGRAHRRQIDHAPIEGHGSRTPMLRVVHRFENTRE